MTRCPVCDLELGHRGPHEATFCLCEASPDWTGSPEQWAHFLANPPRITVVGAEPDRDDGDAVPHG